MRMHIRIAPRRAFASNELWEMHTLRAKVFRGRLGWEVPVLSGMEIDGYDALEPRYMLMRDHQALRGCWRLLPTEGPYMLKDSFPELLDGQEAPSDPRIWELSRFALETDGGGYGFSEMTMESIEAVIGHAHQQGLRRYVTVTTVAIERMLRRAGVVITRIGAPRRVGIETAVALYVEIEATWEALFAARLAS